MTFIVRTVSTKMVELNKQVVLSFVDFSAAFDSISMKAIIESLTDMGASRKSIALVTVIYAAAKAQMRGGDTTFPVDRGALQGDRLSPVIFIVVLAVMLKDGCGGGITIKGVNIDILGYADDLCLVAEDAGASSDQSTSLADKAGDFADMAVNVPKTEAMHVREDAHKQNDVTEAEATAVTATYEHKCQYCPGKAFKTLSGLTKHQSMWCTQAAEAKVVTEKTYKINKIIDCRGPPTNRWYHVSWQGKNTGKERMYNTEPGEKWPDTWEVADNVDGCTDDRGATHTDNFWGRGKFKNLAKDTDVQDPTRPRCPNCNLLCKSQRGLKIHLRWRKCKPVSKHIGIKTRRDVVRRKTKEDAGKLPKVNIQGKDLKTVTVFRYLGSLIESNGKTDRDVEARLGTARTMFNQLYSIFVSKNLSTRQKLKIYKVSVCMIARHGSESWYLTTKIIKKINGWNSRCLVTITGRTHKEEASPGTTSFNLGASIRYQRLKWLGHILRKGPGNLLKKVATTLTTKEDGTYPEGSLFMDAPMHDDNEHLCSLAGDEKGWAAPMRSAFPDCDKEATAAMAAKATRLAGAGTKNLVPDGANANANTNTNEDHDGNENNNDNDDHSNDAAVPIDDDGVPKPDKWIHGKLYHWDPFFGYTSSYN